MECYGALFSIVGKVFYKGIFEKSSFNPLKNFSFFAMMLQKVEGLRAFEEFFTKNLTKLCFFTQLF